MVGRFVYFLTTWSDLGYVVHVMSQVMHEAHEAHWDAIMSLSVFERNSRVNYHVESR